MFGKAYKIFLLIIPALIIFLLSTDGASAFILEVKEKRPAFVPGEVLVSLRPDASLSAITYPFCRASHSLGKTASMYRYYKVTLEQGMEVKEAVKIYLADPTVQAASPNYYTYPMLSPDDTLFTNTPNYLWGLHDTGEDLSILRPGYRKNITDSTPDNDVDAPEAWDVATGSGDVVVAVIDTGIDYTHPDLNDAMWDASSATFNGVDRASSYHGWDFGDGDDNPYPVNSNHGTHIAGIIAATGNNGIGVLGVAYGVKIMALKIFKDAGGGATVSDLIQAINYAAENGACIINISLGMERKPGSLLTMAVKAAVDSDILLVFAAGNGSSNGKGVDNDLSDMYPANFAGDPALNSSIISVMATDQADERADFSNYGVVNVTVGAPGVNIMSTIPGRAVVQQERGAAYEDGVEGSCKDSPGGCFDGTIFDGGSADCTGEQCNWGWGKTSGDFYLLGDKECVCEDPLACRYQNNVDGIIMTRAIDTSVAEKLNLRYTAAWDFECDSDYVDVEVFDGSSWMTLHASDFNINNEGTGPCDSSHTHSGSMHPFWGFQEISHDISEYANEELRVRFVYHTDGSGNTTTVSTVIQIFGVTIDQQAEDYSGSYQFKNGTSMSAPLVSGIGALLKSSNSEFTAVQMKEAIVQGSDMVDGYTVLVSSGGRVNAFQALKYYESLLAEPAPGSPETESGEDSGGCFIGAAAFGSSEASSAAIPAQKRNSLPQRANH